MVDYAFHVAIKDVHGGLIDTMKDALDYGVPSFKVFMVYDFGVTDGVFYQVLEKAKEIGAHMSLHAENNEMVKYLTKKFLSEGKTSGAVFIYLSRSAVRRGLRLTSAPSSGQRRSALPSTSCISRNKEGVDAVTKAKDEGYEIYAETCPAPSELHIRRTTRRS